MNQTAHMQWLYAFIPVSVTFLGAIWVSYRKPTAPVIGAIQHFAAGVVFYAAAGELLPDVLHAGGIWTVVFGGTIGIVSMLLLRGFTKRSEQSSLGLVAASAADALIDGLILGLAFGAGQKQGSILAIALAVEFLFLGVAIAGALGTYAGRWTVVGISTAVACAVPLGVLAARPIGALSAEWQGVAFAFGLIALLYLVTEELLTEAHEKPETWWGASMFFVGFLSMIVIGELMRS